MMNQALRILIVEDDPDIAQIIEINARNMNYQTSIANNAQKAFEALIDATNKQEMFALIILDWMLPGKNGMHILKDLKRHQTYKNIPVIMLTCKGDEDDKIQGLEAGADDYLVKPFSAKELMLRVKKITERLYFQTPQNIKNNINNINNIKKYDVFILDDEAKKIYVTAPNIFKKLNINLDSKTSKTLEILLDLSPTEFKILSKLIHQPKHVFSREQLLNDVWQDIGELQDRTVDVHIKRLRQSIQRSIQKHIENNQIDEINEIEGINQINAINEIVNMIETVRGFGYRLK